MTSAELNYLDHYSSFNDLTAEGRRGVWHAYDLHFAPLLPSSRDSRILDIGCGAGLLLEWLTSAEGYSDVTGIDIDESQVRFARGIGQNAQVVRDIFGWFRNQAPFDVVFMTDVIEHLEDADVAAYLSAIHSHSSSDMSLIVRVPNALSPVASWSLYQDPSHRRLYTIESLSSVLRNCGFSDVRIVDSESHTPGSIREAIILIARTCMRLPLRLRYRLELGRAAAWFPLSHNLLAVARKQKSVRGDSGHTD